MKTESLYNKYRPKSFKEIKGQDLILDLIHKSLKKEKIHHSYLFYGTRGTGKTSLARIFAKALNCEHLDEKTLEPCNKCDSCSSINSGSSLDVVEIDASSNNGVDDIRQLKDKANYMLGLKYKIFIIDEIHMLSKSAFNAFLKLLEEPPKNIVFLMITTEIYKIPETILSRTLILEFESITNETIIENLKFILTKENISFEEEALYNIAILSKGSLRDSISILEKIIIYSKEKITEEDVNKIFGLISKNLLFEIVKNEDQNKLIELFSTNKNNIKNLLNFFINYMIDLLVLNQIKKSNVFVLFIENLIDLLIQTQDPVLIYSKTISIISLTRKNDFLNEMKVLKNKDNEFDELKKNLEIKSKIEKESIELKNSNSKKSLKKSTNQTDSLILENNFKIDLISNIPKYFFDKDYKDSINKFHLFKIINEANSEDMKLYKQMYSVMFVYETHSKFNKYVKILSNAKFELSNSNVILISFGEEEHYEEFKTIAFESNFLEFSKEIFNKEILFLGVLKKQLPTIKKIAFKEKDSPELQKINFEDFFKQREEKEKQGINNLTSFFGKNWK